MTIQNTIAQLTALILLLSFIPATQAGGQAEQTLWVAEYYNNISLSGSPVYTAIEYDIEHDWGFDAPGAGLAADNFSARWRANIPLSAGQYRFQALADDQIRVIVDGQTVIDTFGTTIVDEVVTGDITLGSGLNDIVVEYREYISQAFIYVDFANLSTGETLENFRQTPQQPVVTTGQWVAEYYPNMDLSGSPVAIIGNQEPRANWGNGAPVASLPDDRWSARYQLITTLNAGNYVFRVRADDGVRVYVNNELVINEWHSWQDTVYAGLRNLTAGLHVITVEYYEDGGQAFLEFFYEPANGTFTSSTPGTIITTPEPAQPDVQSRSALGSVTISTGRLNVRDEPNPFTGQILTRVSEGDRYEILEYNDRETWVKINANGTTGWINAGYTVFNAPTLTGNGTEYVVTASPYNVNMRTGPGTQFENIATFNDDDTARVIGRNPASTWWQINYNGIVGWVSARYAQIEARATVQTIPVTSN